MKILFKTRKGMAALFTIVIISAATLIMAVGASFLGLGELEMGYGSKEGGKVLSITEGCIEETLRQLKINPGYVGGSLSLGGGSCIITITPSGSNRSIIALGSFGDYNKRVDVSVTVLGIGKKIIINSWEEVSF